MGYDGGGGTCCWKNDQRWSWLTSDIYPFHSRLVTSVMYVQYPLLACTPVLLSYSRTSLRKPDFPVLNNSKNLYAPHQDTDPVTHWHLKKESSSSNLEFLYRSHDVRVKLRWDLLLYPTIPHICRTSWKESISVVIVAHGEVTWEAWYHLDLDNESVLSIPRSNDSDSGESFLLLSSLALPVRTSSLRQPKIDYCHFVLQKQVRSLQKY